MPDEKPEMTAKSLKEMIEKEPQFTRDSPLDTAFETLYKCIISRVNGLKSYQDVGCRDNQGFVLELLQHFTKIHDAALARQKEDRQDLLPISLHDMRYLDTLIKLILFHGIEGNLAASARTQTCPDDLGCDALRSHQANPQTLATVIHRIFPIVSDLAKTDDYVRMIILKGSMYQSLMLGLLYLSASTADTQYGEMVDVMERAQHTRELFKAYTSLVDTVRDLKLRALLLARISTLPVRRNDGVLSLIEFVTDSTEGQQIDIEKVARVTEILVAKPRTMSSVQYFTNLFEQIREQLSHINRPLVVTCLNDLISTLYGKNRRIIHDFLFKPVFNVLYNMPLKDFTTKEVNDTTNILISLTKNPSVDVIQDLTSTHDQNEFYLHLWIYALFLKKFQTLSPIVYDNDGNKVEGESMPYYNVILSLIKSYMVLTNNFEPLNQLALNLINFDHPQWNYAIDLQTQLASITVKDDTTKLPRSLNTSTQEGQNDTLDLFKDMDLAIDLFFTLLKLIDNEEVTKNLFLNVLSRWVKSALDSKNSGNLDDSGSSALILIDIKILERMNKEFTSEIVKKPEDILLLILELLDSVTEDENKTCQNEADSDDEDEEPIETNDSSSILDTLLALLETVIDSGVPRTSSAAKQTLEDIHEKLKKHRNTKSQDLQSRICNFLSENHSPDLESEQSSTDSKLLHEAMSNLNDPIDPIKVQGLTTLARLAKERSTVVEFPKLRTIFLQHVRFPDPFVYLNAVKGLAVLCETDPNDTVDALLKIYLNADKRHKIDDILKIGESLNLYVQREGELFQGRNANNLVEACLTIVRQHDSLDNRVRMSAISLLGVCLRVNAAGIQDKIPSILDCVFGILQLETTKKNSFVVRRAAIHLVFDLLHDKGLNYLYEGYSRDKLVILLEYVKERDEDALVRGHAAEILETMADLAALQVTDLKNVPE